jgi:hypothetical protein
MRKMATLSCISASFLGLFAMMLCPPSHVEAAQSSEHAAKTWGDPAGEICLCLSGCVKGSRPAMEKMP